MDIVTQCEVKLNVYVITKHLNTVALLMANEI